MGLADLLGQISAGTNGAQALQDYNSNEKGALADYYQQQALAKQQEVATNAATLQALSEAKQNGITNPLQLYAEAAKVNPDYLKNYASMAQSNPLGFALQGGGQQATAGQAQQQSLSDLKGDDLLKA